MSPDNIQPEQQQQPKPTRWVRRIVVALVLATVAWWGVRELVSPRPLARVKLDADHLILGSMRVGPCCLIESRRNGNPSQEGASRILLVDVEKDTLRSEDLRFLAGSWESNVVPFMKSCSNRYVIKKEEYTTLLVYDTLTGEKTSRAFPLGSSVHLGEGSETFLVTTTLPLAPLTALSPAPWSPVSTAFLMSADAQRLYHHVIGPTLVQVRHLPDMQLLAQYAVSAQVHVKHLHWTADGQHLLQTFGTDESPAPDQFIHGSIAHREHRQGKMVMPVNMQNADRFRLLFPEMTGHVENWIHAVTNPDQAVTHSSDPSEPFWWVSVDVSNVWPEMDQRCEVYDARTGTLQYSFEFQHQGGPVHGRCMWMKGDWALFNRVPFGTGMVPYGYRLPLLGMLHVPTGKMIPAEKLPIADWGRDGHTLELQPAGEEGVLLQRVRVAMFGNPYQRDPRSIQTIDRLKKDGTVERVGEYLHSYLDWMVPHSNQLVMGQAIMDRLPVWLLGRLSQWRWLMEKLAAFQLSVVDMDSRATLWSVPMTLDKKTNPYVPQVHVSKDGKLLFVPVDREENRITFVIYPLPVSPWLCYWPWLGAGVVLVLILSQGIRRWRVVRFAPPLTTKGRLGGVPS